MAFMQPEVVGKEDWAGVETTAGFWWVPFTVLTKAEAASARSGDFEPLLKYTEGGKVYNDQSSIKTGYGVRLSAPGYMDASEWEVYGSKKEALRRARELAREAEGEDHATKRAHATKKSPATKDLHFAGYDFRSGPEGTVVHRPRPALPGFQSGDRVEYRDVNLWQQGTVSGSDGKWVMVRWDGNSFESREWAPNLRHVSASVTSSGTRSHATKKSPAQLQREIDEVLAKPVTASKETSVLPPSVRVARAGLESVRKHGIKNLRYGLYRHAGDRMYQWGNFTGTPEHVVTAIVPNASNTASQDALIRALKWKR